jgi:hypothetical protein
VVAERAFGPRPRFARCHPTPNNTDLARAESALPHMRIALSATGGKRAAPAA